MERNFILNSDGILDINGLCLKEETRKLKIWKQLLFSLSYNSMELARHVTIYLKLTYRTCFILFTFTDILIENLGEGGGAHILVVM